MKLNANELTQDINKNIKSSINNIINEIDFNRYPDPSYNSLKSALSKLYDLPKDHILCGNGSDELLSIVCDAFMLSSQNTSEESPILGFMSPSFSEYENIANIKALNYKKFDIDIDQSVQVERLIEYINSTNISYFILCYPNNPIKINYTLSGKPCSKMQDIINFILEQTDTTLILDEAYGEFNDLQTFFRPIIQDRVIRLRTLSKAWGLASLRVGYLLAPSSIIDKIMVAKPIYNINTLSSEIASYVINHRNNAVICHIKEIQLQRNQLISQLKQSDLFENGYKLYESNANFMTIKVDRIDLFNKICKEQKIEVRFFDLSSNINLIRITVGDYTVNKKIYNTIKRYASCYKDSHIKIA